LLHQSSRAHQVLEAKDRAGGFRWRLRKSDNIETGVTERRDKKGQHIGYLDWRVHLKSFLAETGTAVPAIEGATSTHF